MIECRIAKGTTILRYLLLRGIIGLSEGAGRILSSFAGKEECSTSVMSFLDVDPFRCRCVVHSVGARSLSSAFLKRKGTRDVCWIPCSGGGDQICGDGMDVLRGLGWEFLKSPRRPAAKSHASMLRMLDVIGGRRSLATLASASAVELVEADGTRHDSHTFVCRDADDGDHHAVSGGGVFQFQDKEMGERRQRDMKRKRITTSDALRACGGDNQQFAEVLKRDVGDGDIKKLLSLLTLLKIRGDWEIGLRVFEWIRNQRWYRPDVRFYSRMMNLMGDANQTEKARELFDLMKQEGLQPNIYIYTALTRAYGRIGMIWRGIALLQEMKKSISCKPDIVAYNVLIGACLRGSFWELAEGLLRDLRSNGLSATTITYNTFIAAYGKTGMYKEMEEKLMEMQRAGCRPTGSTFTILINAYGKAGRLDKMKEVFESIHVHKCVASVFVYSAMIDTYGKAGMYKEMEELWAEMKRNGGRANHVTYSTLVDAYGKAGDLAMMEQLKEEMLEAGFPPNKFTYNALINAYGKRGAFEKMEAVFKEMRDNGSDLDSFAFTTMIDAHAKWGNWERVEELLTEMRRSGIPRNRVTYTTLIDSYGKAGRIAEMERTVATMLSEHLSPDPVMYGAMLFAYAKARNVAKMEQIAKKIPAMESSIGAGTHSVMIDAYLAAGMVGKAVRLADCAVKAGLQFDPSVYEMMVDAYAAWGMIGEVDKLISTLEQQCCTSTSFAYMSLIYLYLKAGRYEAAKKKYKQLEQISRGQGLNTSILAKLLVGMANCRRRGEHGSLPLVDCLRGSPSRLFSAVGTLLTVEDRHADGHPDKDWEEECMHTIRSLLLKEDSDRVWPLLNSLVDALWISGLRKRAKLLVWDTSDSLWEGGCEWTPDEWKVDFHGMSAGMALLMLHSWLTNAAERLAAPGAEVPTQVTIITGWGKNSRVEGNSPVKNAVMGKLMESGSPFPAVREDVGWASVSGNEFKAWLEKIREMEAFVLRDERES
ncbi:hypothetical protein CBR_g12023 [Chara braunii]|nr:hypothetical protein CBR_g12023 [Chara braunii]|eukprot:GBG72449.1 hypothetical protein CBR_g12023 [Chara braunii]